MKLKFSKRGLTFSFNETETFKAGTRYRYIIDAPNAEVILLPDAEGKYKLSRKGVHAKPLVDLRNAEIRQAMEKARYMEVEVQDDKIIVHIIKATLYTDTVSENDLAELIDRSNELTFAIDKKTLRNNNGALTEMLEAAGLFSAKTRRDISYVFDTVSLFSGAGLLDWPFHQDEAFNIRLAVDFDKAACETYRANIGDHILCMDIRELADVPDADLVIGGPCCQGYSNANRAGNVKQDKEKRLLIDDYIRLVKSADPLIFVIENVRQFVTKEHGKYLGKVISELSMKYNITYSIVNDHDLGGYSRRERMVLLGSVKEMGKVILPDVHLASKRTVGDALKKVGPDWFNYEDVTHPSPETRQKMACVRQGHNFRDIPEMSQLDRHSSTYRRLALDEPSVTITNWRKTNILHPTEDRILTVAEAAAIMGLDQRFKFYGALNARQQQVGNGVTQAIARFIKEIVKNALFRYANSRILPCV